MEIKALISSGNQIISPVLLDKLTLQRYIGIKPAVVSFSAINSEVKNITEGCMLSILKDGVNIFYGYIFEIAKGEYFTEITAYDQLRYLKNRDTYKYSGIKASELVKMIADDFGLKCGEIEDTGYVIPYMLEYNKTLADIIQNSLDITEKNTGKAYVLYDFYGRLTLKAEDTLSSSLYITEDNLINITETTSIDNCSYNKIKLSRSGLNNSGEVFQAEDSQNIEKWGILQHFETISAQVNGVEYSKELLKLYNKKSHEAEVNVAKGDISIRGGSKVYLKTADEGEPQNMTVQKVSHIFCEGRHTMGLSLLG